MSRFYLSHLLIALAVCGVTSVVAERPNLVFPETTFDFGKMIRGAPVEHAFAVRNSGSAPVRVAKISMTPPLIALKVPDKIAPGTEAQIPFRLDTAQVRGIFEGRALVFFDGRPEPEVLKFEGKVIETIEVSPRPAFFLGALRGEARTASLDIINHEPEPLAIKSVEHAKDRFATKLDTVEPGRRYRLTMTLKPDGPGGRSRETITLKTSSRNHPVLSIAANTYLRERVYAFPDSVDFGAVPLSEAPKVPQVVVVRQNGGKTFEIKVTSDLPFLSVEPARTPEGDGYELTVSLIAGAIKPGAIRGQLSIHTNDKEFPLLVLPVSGFVIGR